MLFSCSQSYSFPTRGAHVGWVCVGIGEVIHTWRWRFTALCGSDRTGSHIKEKKRNGSKVHSCVIANLPALVLVYCKHPHANHPLHLAVRAATPGQHVAMGRLESCRWSLHSHAGEVDAHSRLSPVYGCMLTRPHGRFSIDSHENDFFLAPRQGPFETSGGFNDSLPLMQLIPK